MNDCYGVGKIYIFPKNILENIKCKENNINIFNEVGIVSDGIEN